MENNNYPEEKLELLERYLRQELNTEEARRVEDELNSSENLREQLVLLQRSQEAVHTIGVQERVKAARSRANNRAKGKQVFFDFGSRRLVAVAAVLFPLIMVTILFSASTTDRIYSKNYLSYQLPISRNTEVSKTTIENLFQEKKYQKLLQITNGNNASNKDQKSLFLVAIASMELNEFGEAVQLLEELKRRHSQEKEKLFEQESDFYLALAYAKTGETSKAKGIFEEIRDNKRHLYHKNISYWDVWMLTFSN